jgi:hypothetical protein
MPRPCLRPMGLKPTLKRVALSGIADKVSVYERYLERNGSRGASLDHQADNDSCFQRRFSHWALSAQCGVTIDVRYGTSDADNGCPVTNLS